jgi:hypothetical protein
LDIFENVRVLAYADDLKLYLRVNSTDDYRLFQQDLNRLQGWCCEKKYDLNAGKCKSISFSCGSNLLMFQYAIGNSDLERVDVICDPVDHLESIVSKSAKILRFKKRISKEFNDPYTYKMLNMAFVWPGLEYACGCLIKRFIWR